MGADTLEETDAGHEERYRAFLLRCWLETPPGPGEDPAWRFALLEAGRDRPHGFSTLDDVAAFLRGELAAQATRQFADPGSQDRMDNGNATA